MEVLAEKDAEEFLQKEGFKVIDSFFVQQKEEIQEVIKKIKSPFVMKVSGKKILHKNKLGGVKLGISDYEHAAREFNILMKIKGSEGVIIQPQISGEEFLLGIKSTKEFGHVIAFGIGGTNVEKIKKVEFRACPLENKDADEMIREIKEFSEADFEIVKKNILKLCKLSKRYPNIEELDINPLVVESGKAEIVDARIAFN